MAVATPAMLPVPMVEARAVASVCVCVRPFPLPPFRLRSTEPTVVRSQRPQSKSWKKPVRTEK